jgi:ceramide glucosyltransferase
LLLVLTSAIKFSFKKVKTETASNPEPALSLLKPIHGAEPDLDLNLSSFFTQTYPNYEVLVCARSLNDPGFAVLDQISAKYPTVQIQKIASGEPPWINPRTYSVHVMMQAAKHSLLVITDSDVRVDANFLRSISSHFQDKQVGLVTCLYRGVTKAGLWARLEALGMSVEMSSGVLVAEMLEGMKFALGPSMAVRKEVIDAIGGLEEVAEYYADDFVLGNRVSKAGYRVVLSPYVIEHVITNSNFLASIRHQLGWARSTRFSRPKGHIGTVLTYAMPFALLGLLAGWLLGNWKLGVALLLCGIVNRMLQCIAVGWGVVRDKASLTYCWLYPVRDLMGFIFWVWSYLSDEVRYRGEIYTLFDEGKIRLKHHQRY